MSKKRTSAESSNDEQTNEDSDVFRQMDDDKRGKLASFSDTTLQDIPTEILQCILVKAVVMEVKNMKLAKRAWKEKADLVISRLGSVCSQWNSVLTTDFFRKELHRALDGTARETIHMEILHESLVNDFVIGVTTLKNDMLMLCRHYQGLSSSFSIAVYDRNNVEKVKEVIPLPGIRERRMAGCKVSNCVYILDMNRELHNMNKELHNSSIVRITRDEEHKFNIQTWITDLGYPISCGSFSVSDKGNLMIISRPDRFGSCVVRVYNESGFLKHEIIISPETYEFICDYSNVIQKSNGNLVVALFNEWCQMVLTEIDTNEIIQRQYKSSRDSRHRWSAVGFADTSERILMHDLENRIELFDSELNLLEFTYLPSTEDDFLFLHCLHFNSERNEAVVVYDVKYPGDDENVSLLRIFRLREE